jgi:hypothetical protein
MFAEKFKNLFAPQLPRDDNFAVVVDAMNLEDILCEITPMVLICMWTAPSGVSFFNEHLLAHLMP